MRKILLLLFIFIAFDCTSFDFKDIEKRIPGKTDVVFSKLKELILADGFVLAEENPDSGVLVTNWKKLDRTENNIPDNTIEGMIQVSLTKIDGDVRIVLGVKKRSSLSSLNIKGKDIQYDEVGMMYNDFFFKKWKQKIELFKLD